MEKIPVVQIHALSTASTEKFHVKIVEGKFQNLRRLISWPLIALFFLLVWVQINDQPWLLFSFAQRQIILFGHSLSWHDLPLLAGLMIAGASLLFFLAVAWGRVWCGFACPQSIWTWLFIRIEDWTEGRASERARADTQPLRGERLLRRALKHLLWIALALITTLTFTGYFVPIREIIDDLFHYQASATLVGWIIIMTGLTYANAGLVREKICLHACPYSRFQSVMFDQDTLTVSYDAKRGEPRAHKRQADTNSGDCVDCHLCVQVCPTGIDIRNGLQAECIDCGACIDACNTVMDKLSLPRGLIRFASASGLQDQPERVLRPRLISYAVAMVIAFGAVLYGFTETTQLLVEIRRDRGALFTQLDENTICNHYRLKIEGFGLANQKIAVTLKEHPAFQLYGPPVIDLSENNAVWLPYRVCAENMTLPKSEVLFELKGSAVAVTKKTTFIAMSI
ncbi:cytochrome c oxidase accessory protein CcoG [Neptuniibacter sp. CAU 1671]|uniref:cytochrome c oxidase accessory protein CcoG n=1 Tax=Neptuniibacter sp. CAU 1671 TaxID=3032593 RepID=UPI0023DB50DD|nr:cytochrome c oxidase accessory protein CcoG [Neptuniibacter sp. CAU 1671]MDF2180632.1 cytochrome c oxidase accessory protein CcoG [Neptuniibacter sp. CAU 1671]